MIFVLLAVAPDLDILFEELDVAVHRGASHSLGLAAACGFLVGIIALLRRRSFLVWSMASFVAVASHGVLDLLSPGPGVKLLWPLSDALFTAPVRPLVTAPIGELLSGHGWLLLAIEAVIFSPILIWAWWRQGRSADRPSVRSG